MRLNVEITLKVELYGLAIRNFDYPRTVNILGVVWWIVRRCDVPWWVSIIQLNETTTSWRKAFRFNILCVTGKHSQSVNATCTLNYSSSYSFVLVMNVIEVFYMHNNQEITWAMGFKNKFESTGLIIGIWDKMDKHAVVCGLKCRWRTGSTQTSR